MGDEDDGSSLSRKDFIEMNHELSFPGLVHNQFLGHYVLEFKALAVEWHGYQNSR